MNLHFISFSFLLLTFAYNLVQFIWNEY